MKRSMDEVQLVPQRIKEAREYRFLSVIELADKIGKTRQAVSQYENGTTKPTSDILARIADVTEFPIQYFFKHKRVSTASSSEMPLYRGSKAKTKNLKNSYKIVVDWSRDIIDYLSRYVILLDVNLPVTTDFDFLNSIDTEKQIEKISESLRTYWSLGKGPIQDVIGVLENNGFIISKIPHKAKEVEAFSVWYERHPYIFYEGNRDTSVSYLFSVCHELGHLILHQSLTENEATDPTLYKSLEMQANTFAGAFLMPAESFGKEYLTSNLDSFIAIKKKWKVSLSAMIMRAYALRIIDDQQKGYLFRQLSSRGYRKREPFDDEMNFEAPSLIFNSIKMLIDNNLINAQDFVDDIAIPVNDLSMICSFPEEFTRLLQYSKRGSSHLRLIGS